MCLTRTGLETGISNTDITIEVTFTANVTAGTRAYALIISAAQLSLASKNRSYPW